jgi:hypothetical protein
MPALILICIWVFGLLGWVLNIITVAGSDFGVITGLLVLRIVGIFIAPLGAVLGYI